MSDERDTRQLARDTNSLIKHAARREKILAGSGAFPTFDELRKGLPFAKGDFLHDVRTFIGTELLQPYHTPKARKALALAASNATAATLRAASDAMPDASHDAARRLDLYAALLGDKLGRDRTIRRGFEDIRLEDVAYAALPLTMAFGLTRYSVRSLFTPTIETSTVDRVLEEGVLVMKRIAEYSARLEAAIEASERDEAAEAESPMADAMDAIAALPQDPPDDLEYDDAIPDHLLGTPPGPPKDLLVVPYLDPKGGNSNSRDNRKSWIGIAGEKLPLVQTGDVAGIAADLSARWPHAHDIIHTILGDLSLGGPARFRPTLLVGEPGSGKTALLRAIADACGLDSEAYNMAGQADASLMGTSSQWSTARESNVLQLIKRTRRANAVMIWDEIEKIGTRTENGNAMEALLPYFEPHQSRRMRDLCLEVECDLSMVSHFATANSVSKIPAPLRDRMRILRMPDADWSHLGTLVGQIVADIARDRGVDARWYQPLAEDEIDVIKSARPGGSLRRLRMDDREPAFGKGVLDGELGDRTLGCITLVDGGVTLDRAVSKEFALDEQQSA